jgi:hypothetical protein
MSQPPEGLSLAEYPGGQEASACRRDEASSAPQREGDDVMSGQGSPPGLIALMDLVAGGYHEILGVLESLREGKSALDRVASDRIHQTHDKLREVSEATEAAATDILNGLERATTMVDDLDALAAASSAPDDGASPIRAALRDELFGVMGHMQFQDITSQQLAHASSLLADMEARLLSIARIFDPAGSALMVPALATTPVAYDPNASTQNREERQAIADGVFETSENPR